MDKDASEIAKLTERISKDPKSKLFVPLAEEYKKAGDLEMAVRVLLEGLEHNPGYVTAKTFLGRLLMEKGDLSGAQKEFEEVVKAVPDNLLAHRKLGDLYVLQDQRSEALKHYKSALALNPGDKDLASFVSDVESGVDVRPRLQRQKTKPSPEPAPPMTESSRATEPEAAGTVGEAGPPKPDKTPEPAEAIWELASQATPLAMPLEHEEAEEVLYVEPLDDELPEMSPEPEGAGAQPIDQSDDFTTSTLAELYIAQGFFEKAIDIYERMYADHPNNRGLKEKLDGVKSMAAASAVSEDTTPETLAETSEPTVICEPKGSVSPEEKETEELIIDAELLAEPEKAKPATSQAGESEETTSFMEKEMVYAAPKRPAATRQVTIERLETWLKNIVKEK